MQKILLEVRKRIKFLILTNVFLILALIFLLLNPESSFYFQKRLILKKLHNTINNQTLRKDVLQRANAQFDALLDLTLEDLPVAYTVYIIALEKEKKVLTLSPRWFSKDNDFDTILLKKEDRLLAYPLVKLPKGKNWGFNCMSFATGDLNLNAEEIDEFEFYLCNEQDSEKRLKISNVIVRYGNRWDLDSDTIATDLMEW